MRPLQEKYKEGRLGEGTHKILRERKEIQREKEEKEKKSRKIQKIIFSMHAQNSQGRREGHIHLNFGREGI